MAGITRREGQPAMPALTRVYHWDSHCIQSTILVIVFFFWFFPVVLTLDSSGISVLYCLFISTVLERQSGNPPCCPPTHALKKPALLFYSSLDNHPPRLKAHCTSIESLWFPAEHRGQISLCSGGIFWRILCSWNHFLTPCTGSPSPRITTCTGLSHEHLHVFP